jgi:hypothetical protein
MAIVVSEMTGRISIALGGNIAQDVSIDRLRLRIIQHFGPVVAAPRGTPMPLIDPLADGPLPDKPKIFQTTHNSRIHMTNNSFQK